MQALLCSSWAGSDTLMPVAPPPRSSASHREVARVEADDVADGSLRVAFRGGYHCRCREIGRKMGNPAAWWQMVDHRGRESRSLRPLVLRGRRQGMGRIHRGHWAGTRSYMDAKLGTVMYVGAGRRCGRAVTSRPFTLSTINSSRSDSHVQSKWIGRFKRNVESRRVKMIRRNPKCYF